MPKPAKLVRVRVTEFGDGRIAQRSEDVPGGLAWPRAGDVIDVSNEAFASLMAESVVLGSAMIEPDPVEADVPLSPPRVSRLVEAAIAAQAEKEAGTVVRPE